MDVCIRGPVAGIVLRGISRDTTAERLEASQLRRLVDTLGRTEHGVIATDLNCRVEWVNDGFTRLTGWTLDDVVGKVPGASSRGRSPASPS